MERMNRRRALQVVVAAGVSGIELARSTNVGAVDHRRVGSLEGRLVAVGIPGAGAVSQVGVFLPGGPIHDTPDLAASTAPGQVLDPSRILVGSTSNFGAEVANADQSPGSFLSLDVDGDRALVVPATFASAGGQSSTLGGAVQMYSAQSPDWRNGVYNPAAVTAAQVGVSNPLGLSINNAFGRVWPANAPYGLTGPGSSSICDPDGRPLKAAPNPTTGGVYLGDLTGRQPVQVVPGALRQAAVATALLGRSPDGSGRAVFAVVAADGSIVQEHTAKALDGLAPAGTVRPLRTDHRAGGVMARCGAVLNYSPRLVLYVSQPQHDSIAAIDLATGGPAGNEVFVPAGVRLIRSPVLAGPVDLAPASVETEDPNWASNTTLEEGADLYVCNAGNDTVARIGQAGAVVAVRRVRVDGRPLGAARLNGIATAADGTRIWATYVGRLPGQRDRLGGVIELPAF
jgi:hypothetical protein